MYDMPVIPKNGAEASASAPSLIGGGYLLSHFRSTIGVAGFNFSVRNGKRWSPRAIATLIRLSVAPRRGRAPYKVKKSWKNLSLCFCLTRFSVRLAPVCPTFSLGNFVLQLRAPVAAAFLRRRRLFLGALLPGKGLGD